MDYIKSLKYLLGKNLKNLIPLAFIFLFASIIDLVSIGLIGGYLAIIVDPSFYENEISQYPNLEFLTTMGQTDAILLIGYILVAAFLVKFFLLIFTNYLILKFATQEQAKIQKLMVKGILDQEYENFILSKGGENLASIATYSSVYKDVLQAILQLMSNSIVIIAVFILLGSVSFKTLSILILMLVVIFFLYNFLLTSRVGAYGKEYADSIANIMKGTSEVSHGMKELKTLGKEKFFLNSVNKSANLIARSALRLNLYSILPKNIIEVILISFIVLIITINVASNGDLGRTLSILGVFAASTIRIAPLVSQIQANVNSLVFGQNSIMLLSKIMENHGTDVKDDSDNFKKDLNRKDSNNKPFKNLQLENVSYAYPNSDHRSLENINLTIEKGDFIGLIGPSGAGKTTLVDVMLGFLKPSSGVLKVNGLDAHDNIMEWRSHCAYLPQEIFLIDGTLEENITLNRNKVNPDNLTQALKLSKLEFLTIELPKGLDTNLGDKGVRLSGGQKQRVAMARAIYHQREILLLDESTSALDSQTEKEVMDELVGLKSEKTIIAIAHRITTLKECNKIFKLEKGLLSGPFDYKDIATE